MMYITCIDYPNTKPRSFINIFNYYNCTILVAHESQFEYEIKIRGGYILSYFELRHKRRMKVTGSLNRWSKN